MARTLNGNLTGRAARIIDQLPEYDTKAELGEAMHHLRALDPRWEVWYDAEVTEGDYGHILAQVRTRIAALLNSSSAEVRRIRGQIDETYSTGRYWDGEEYERNHGKVQAEIERLGLAALEVEADGGFYCPRHGVYHDVDCPECYRRDREDYRP